MAKVISFEEVKERVSGNRIQFLPKPIWWGQVKYKVRIEGKRDSHLRFMAHSSEEVFLTPPIFVEAWRKDNARQKIISIFQANHPDVIQYFLDSTLKEHEPPYQVVISKTHEQKKMP